MGSSQSIISKEDMEAYKQLTYFTEAEIKNCLQKFSELLDPNTPFKSVHDPEARVQHENVVNGMQELKGNPFAKRICQVFSPNAGQLDPITTRSITIVLDQTTIAVGATIAILLILLVASVVILIFKKLKQKRRESQMKTEGNAVYGQ